MTLDGERSALVIPVRIPIFRTERQLRSRTGLAAFQVRIAYFTPHRRTKHYFHQLVLAADQQGAVADARAQLEKRSPNASVVHAAATLRPDSHDAEAAILAGWKLRDNWWTRPIGLAMILSRSPRTVTPTADGSTRAQRLDASP